MSLQTVPIAVFSVRRGATRENRQRDEGYVQFLHRHGLPRSGKIVLRSKFFLLANALLLAIVLVGFSRTLYLRAFFDVAPIPVSLYIHGAALTLWFLFALIQPWLIGAKDT